MPYLPHNLRDQLAPVAATMRDSRSIIRPVSQVAIKLKSVAGQDRFALTVRTILRWMDRRAGRDLPASAWEGKSFELADIGAQRTAAVAIESPRYWAARLDDADRLVPMRTWVTEIGAGCDGNGDVLFGARLICTSRGVDEPFERSIPGFVWQIMGSGPAEMDGLLIQREPRFVESDDDVESLVSFLEYSDRQSDVIVLALPEDSSNIDEAIIPARDLQGRLLGLSHVFVIAGHASFLLTRRIGKELSVFRSAVRTYRPGFKPWVSEPAMHPLALPLHIESRNSTGSRSFEDWLVGHAIASSVSARQREERLPSFIAVRQRAAEIEREKLREDGGSEADLLSLFEQDNDKLSHELKEQRDQYDGLLASADAEVAALREAADAAKSQVRERAYRIRLLEARLNELSTVALTVPIPDTFDDFEDWCKEHLVGSVELINRAFTGVRKSDFHEPGFIYRSLLFLRDCYVPMRIEGSAQRHEEFQNKLAELQLEDSPIGDGAFEIRWDGRNCLVDRHLKGSNSRDRRYGFRLYYFWDEDNQVAVVAWLPSHMDNRLT